MGEFHSNLVVAYVFPAEILLLSETFPRGSYALEGNLGNSGGGGAAEEVWM